MRTAIVAIYALLEAMGLEDLAMWLLIAIATIIGCVAAAYVLTLLARWLVARSPWELATLIVLFVAGAFSLITFGFIPTAKWVALGIALTVAAIACILMLSEASTRWISAVGAAVAVVLCALVAQLLLSWLEVRNELALMAGAAATAALSGLIISVTRRHHVLAVLLAAITCAVSLPHVAPTTAFALALRSWLATGVVLVGLSGGLLFGLSRKSSSLVK